MRKEFLIALAKGEDLNDVRRSLFSRIDDYRDAWRRGVEADYETAQLVTAALKQSEGEARAMADKFMADAQALVLAEQEEAAAATTTIETEGTDDDEG